MGLTSRRKYMARVFVCVLTHRLTIVVWMGGRIQLLVHIDGILKHTSCL